MIVSIASGKGGTGKTTVAANLALIAGKQMQVRMLDCDVEEPNLHLFLKPEISDIEPVYMKIPEVDQDTCTYCRKCVDICQFSAIAIVGKKILTFPSLCHGCDGCFAVCPEGAIRESQRELGVVQTGTVNGFDFYDGVLRIGEAMSPPLISQVKENLHPDKLNIIDAPPGTSCPVITAMKGTDFVLLVTEPTPFGLHDLKLAVEAVKVLGIPMGLVINRSGVRHNEVQQYAEQENLTVLAEIPFDRRIAEAYSKGKLVVLELPEYEHLFVDLYDGIMDVIYDRKKKEISA